MQSPDIFIGLDGEDQAAESQSCQPASSSSSGRRSRGLETSPTGSFTADFSPSASLGSKSPTVSFGFNASPQIPPRTNARASFRCTGRRGKSPLRNEAEADEEAPDSPPRISSKEYLEHANENGGEAPFELLFQAGPEVTVEERPGDRGVNNDEWPPRLTDPTPVEHFAKFTAQNSDVISASCHYGGQPTRISIVRIKSHKDTSDSHGSAGDPNSKNTVNGMSKSSDESSSEDDSESTEEDDDDEDLDDAPPGMPSVKHHRRRRKIDSFESKSQRSSGAQGSSLERFGRKLMDTSSSAQKASSSSVGKLRPRTDLRVQTDPLLEVSSMSDQILDVGCWSSSGESDRESTRTRPSYSRPTMPSSARSAPLSQHSSPSGASLLGKGGASSAPLSQRSSPSGASPSGKAGYPPSPSGASPLGRGGSSPSGGAYAQSKNLKAEIVPKSSAELFAALRGEDEDLCLALLRGDADPDAVDPEFGGSALLFAKAMQLEGCVMLLLEFNAKPLALCSGKLNQKALVSAIQEPAGAGNAGVGCIVAKCLLAGVDIEQSEERGFRPLHFACWNGHGDAVKMMLVANAFMYPQNDFGYTPLHYAAMAGRLEVVKILIQHEVNVNFITGVEPHRTPLQLAESAGQLRVADALLLVGGERLERDPNSSCCHTHINDHISSSVVSSSPDNTSKVSLGSIVSGWAFQKLAVKLPSPFGRKATPIDDELRRVYGEEQGEPEKEPPSVTFDV